MSSKRSKAQTPRTSSSSTSTTSKARNSASTSSNSRTLGNQSTKQSSTLKPASSPRTSKVQEQVVKAQTSNAPGRGSTPKSTTVVNITDRSVKTKADAVSAPAVQKSSNPKSSSNSKIKQAEIDKIFVNPHSIGLINQSVYKSYQKDVQNLLSNYRSGNESRLDDQARSITKEKQATPARVSRSSNKLTDVGCSAAASVSGRRTEKEKDTDVITYNEASKGKLEALIANNFAQPSRGTNTNHQREGNSKLSYNYLLLDSRSVLSDDKSRTVNDFADSIIYVGKGKNSRAYDHTKEARKLLDDGVKTSSSAKINKIHEVWRDDAAVVVLKTATNITAEEAFTREALMIEALRYSKKGITNKKGGEYYGEASVIKPEEKRELGVALLADAKEILEGKRAPAVAVTPSCQSPFSVL